MKVILAIICSFLALFSFGQKENSYLRKGNSQYKEGQFKEAEKDYRKALEINKESSPGQFNLGTAVYQEKNYKESGDIFSALAGKNVDKETKAKALHNLGNSLLESKEYEKSIAAYKNALINNPKDIDTKYNLEYARMMLKKQQQQNQDKNQDQKKDKQDQNQQNPNQNKQNQQPDTKKISKEDAERMLEAMKNAEKNTMEKVKKQQAKAVQVRVARDW